jgi:DNA polymerase III subunit gamma/tau
LREARLAEVVGDTVVVQFRYPTHVSKFNSELLVAALSQAFGGKWQVRCEAAGAATGSSRPAAPARSQPPAPQAQPRPGNQPTQATQPAQNASSAAAPAAEDWPECAVPGGVGQATATGQASTATGSGPAGGAGVATQVPKVEPKRAASPDTVSSASPRFPAAPPNGPTAQQRSAGDPGWEGLNEAPPFDPEYDSGDFPGFDPGDEPSDDDPVAPQGSSEEQAVRLLTSELSAELIGD